MAQESTGTIWGLPNYAGVLATADQVNTPFLTAIGANPMQTQNFEFPTSSEFDFPAASQPAITEDGSKTAPTATHFVRDQKKNVTQIFHRSIDLTYVKQSNGNRLSGINTQGSVNNVADEKAAQIEYNLKQIARDANYTALRGSYQISTASNVANKTRGMIELCESFNVVDASSAVLSKALMDALLLAMFNAGATFENPMIVCNARLNQAITDIYSYAPEDRFIGGTAIKQIVTPYGNLGIIVDRSMTDTDLLVVDIAYISQVFQPVPGKGNFFVEDLSKTGAADKMQIFGQWGLNHGPGFKHGKIKNLG